MREQVKTRLASASGALLTSVILAAFRSGKLGEGTFAFQLCATLIILSWSIYLHRTSLLSSLPNIISLPLSVAWLSLCFAPTFWHLLIYLFTGHRVEGAEWYHALWRVYAIMGLWLLLAVVNERIVRPWWRKNSDKILGFARGGSSISEQARKLTEDRRAAALDAIKQRIIRVMKKKILAERGIDQKKKEIEEVDESMQKAEKMLEKARVKMEAAEGEEKESAKEEVSTMQAMMRNAKMQKQGLLRDIERAKLDIEDIQPQIADLQQEWTEALHIENYTRFYR